MAKETSVMFSFLFFLCLGLARASISSFGQEKVTYLHFFLNDILSGTNPSAVLVARPNSTQPGPAATPFGSVYVINDPLTDAPNGKVIGNAQGIYASTGKEGLSLILAMDVGFTSGPYKGSSISVFSRNPVSTEGERELAVVGGRGHFRLARGFAQLNTYFFNVTNGDAIIEYNVTVLHY